MKKSQLIVAAALAVVSSTAPSLGESIGFPYVPFNPTTGGSTSSDNFVVTRLDNADYQIELALKATRRSSYSDIAGPNGVYRVQSGTSTGTQFWWSLEFSADLGQRNIANTPLRLTVSFTPEGTGPTVSRVLETNFNSTPFAGTRYFFSSWAGTPGSDRIQSSDNLGASRYGSVFDSESLGVYTLTLEALVDGQSIAAVTMRVDNTLIPLPTAAGMTLAGIGLVGMRRRR